MTFFRFVVSGLTTGETYIFRVQAINELGLSDESQESAPLSVRAALSQYPLFSTTITDPNIDSPLKVYWCHFGEKNNNN